MEKEENLNTESSTPEDKKINEASPDSTSENDNPKEKTPDEKILELEDKITRTFAEMENQRRRFEKEKDEAYEYGGYNFAREALNLIDNLERSKQTLENDDELKNSNALKKILEHLNVINKDLISIFSKNNIKKIECLGKKLDPNFHQAINGQPNSRSRTRRRELSRDSYVLHN